jgi:hypothetical protein
LAGYYSITKNISINNDSDIEYLNQNIDLLNTTKKILNKEINSVFINQTKPQKNKNSTEHSKKINNS